jgi:hypothetical protein
MFVRDGEAGHPRPLGLIAAETDRMVVQMIGRTILAPAS